MYLHMCNCLFTYQPFDVYITFRFKKANGHTLSLKFETSLRILQPVKIFDMIIKHVLLRFFKIVFHVKLVIKCKVYCDPSFSIPVILFSGIFMWLTTFRSNSMLTTKFSHTLSTLFYELLFSKSII